MKLIKIIIITPLLLSLQFSYAQKITLEKVHRMGFKPFSTSTKDGEYQVNFDGEFVSLLKKSDGAITCKIRSNTRQLIEDDAGKLHKPRILEGSMPFCVELDNIKDTDAPIHQPAAMLVAAD